MARSPRPAGGPDHRLSHTERRAAAASLRILAPLLPFAASYSRPWLAKLLRTEFFLCPREA